MPELAEETEETEAEPQWKKQAPVLKVRVPAPKKEGGAGVRPGAEQDAGCPSSTGAGDSAALGPRLVPVKESPFARAPGADRVVRAVKVVAPPQPPVDVEKVEALAKAASDEFKSAEEKVTEALDVAKPLMADAKEVTQEMAEEAAQASESAVNKAILAVQAAARSVGEKAKEMGKSEVAAKIKNSSDFNGFYAKFKHYKKQMEELRSAVQLAKKRTPDERAIKAQQEVFDKFDGDKDGFLKREELIEFAKGDCSFELSEEQAAKIFGSLAGDAAGVPADKLQRLRAMVGIDRVLFRAAERERKKAEFQEVAAEFNKELQEAEEAAATAKALSAELGAKTLQKVRGAVEQVEKGAAAAKEQAEKAQGIVDKMAPAEGAEEDELVKGYREELTSKFSAQKAALLATAEAAVAGTEKAKKRFEKAAVAEMEALRLQVAMAVRGAMEAKKKTAEQIFEQAAAKAEAVTQEQFVKFVTGLAKLCPKEALPEALQAIDAAKAEGLFSHVAGSADGNVGKDSFLWLFTRLGYLVLKETPLTEKKAAGETKRQLQAGEVTEALDLSESKADDGAKYVRVRACKDSAEGWACIGEEAAEGGDRLEPLGATFTCVKETILTGALKIADGETVRRIARGEVLEALDFEMKDDACGIMRVECKAKKDGKTGWVSIASNTGLAFLERLR